MCVHMGVNGERQTDIQKKKRVPLKAVSFLPRVHASLDLNRGTFRKE